MSTNIDATTTATDAVIAMCARRFSTPKMQHSVMTITPPNERTNHSSHDSAPLRVGVDPS